MMAFFELVLHVDVYESEPDVSLVQVVPNRTKVDSEAFIPHLQHVINQREHQANPHYQKKPPNLVHIFLVIHINLDNVERKHCQIQEMSKKHKSVNSSSVEPLKCNVAAQSLTVVNFQVICHRASIHQRAMMRTFTDTRQNIQSVLNFVNLLVLFLSIQIYFWERIQKWLLFIKCSWVNQRWKSI